MNSISSKLLAAALCGAVLAGCNLVEDVPDTAHTKLPQRRQVIQGTVIGLGNLRSITLINNGLAAETLTVRGVTSATPVNTDTGPLLGSASFTYGARDIVDANGKPVTFDVKVKDTPYGRICDKIENGSGVLDETKPPVEIIITCRPDPAVNRFDLTVALDPLFSKSVGAKVRLTTEEGIYEVTPAFGATSQTFKKVLFNAATTNSTSTTNGSVGAVAGSPLPPDASPIFRWSVTATNTAGDGQVNRCPVNTPTNTLNPSGNIVGTLPVPTTQVGPSIPKCFLTISGVVRYSLPAGVAIATAAPSLGAGGLTLEIRDSIGNFKASQVIPAGAFPTAATAVPAGSAAYPQGIFFTFKQSDGTDFEFQSNQADPVLQAVVTRNPTGQTCVVGDGGHLTLGAVSPATANSTTLILNNPLNITALGVTNGGNVPSSSLKLTPTFVAVTAPTSNTPYILGTRLAVFCRNNPATANVLKGTYRLSKQTATYVAAANATATSPVATVTNQARWIYGDTRTQNFAQAVFVQFFDDGTFLYGSAGSSVGQVEHGFYNYNAATGRLQFTTHTDTGNTNYGYTVALAPTTTNFTFPASTTFTGTSVAGTVTPGLSSSPWTSPPALAPLAITSGSTVTPTTNPDATQHMNMCNVTKGYVTRPLPSDDFALVPPPGAPVAKRINGSFGNLAGLATACNGGGAVMASTCTGGTCGSAAAGTGRAPPIPVAGAANIIRQLDWELEEPQDIAGEMTGAWTTQDHLRMWVFDADFETGTHVGVNGVANMQNACVTMANYHSFQGEYTRRTGQTGCVAVGRLSAAQVLAGTQPDAGSNMDLPGTGLGSPTTLTLPAWNGPFGSGRMPNMNSGFDSRPLSPARFLISKPTEADFVAALATGDAPTVASQKASFPMTEDANGNGALDAGEDDNANGVLDKLSFTWCTTEILAVRQSLNGVPIGKPIYFCRNKLGASEY